MSATKLLCVFDFDNTVIDGDADQACLKSHPGQLPESLKALHTKGGDWTVFMTAACKYMSSQGVTPERLQPAIEQLPLNQDMGALFDVLLQNKSSVECIIISDCNSVFISWVLSAHGYAQLFTDIYTNIATWQSDVGTPHLSIKPFHSHDCSTCPVNMCKSKILHEHIKRRSTQGVIYNHVFYVGDGGNDYCPCSQLAAADKIFCRQGFPLENRLQVAMTDLPGTIKAQVLSWKSAQVILDKVLPYTQPTPIHGPSAL